MATVLLATNFTISASNFGTEKAYSMMFPPTAFTPQNNLIGYHKDVNTLYVLSGGAPNFSTVVHLPTGAKPTALIAILQDNNLAEDINVTFSRSCNGFGLLNRPNTVITNIPIASVSSSGNGGNRSYYSTTVSASDSHHINNLNCAYSLTVFFNTSAAGPDYEFNRVAITYKRDVTPAPIIAPYSDVPASHPFAQHINAFKNAGITGGCGGGNYCPDDPVTRGQMAVFLSKAMGLSWNDSNGSFILQPPF